MYTRPRGRERPTGEVLWPFLGFFGKVAGNTNRGRTILVQEGGKGVCEGGRKGKVTMSAKGKKGAGSKGRGYVEVSR